MNEVDWIERVRTEKAELGEKIINITKFLMGSESARLSIDARRDIEDQADAMRRYFGVLHRRLMKVGGL